MNTYVRFTLWLLASAVLLSSIVSCSIQPPRSYNYSPAIYSDLTSYNNWHQKNFNQTYYPSEDFGRSNYYGDSNYGHNGYGNYYSGDYRNDRHNNPPYPIETPPQQRTDYAVESQRMQGEYQQQQLQAGFKQQQQHADYAVETQRMQAEYQEQKAIADVQVQVQRAQYAVEKAKQKAECEATGRTDCE